MSHLVKDILMDLRQNISIVIFSIGSRNGRCRYVASYSTKMMNIVFYKYEAMDLSKLITYGIPKCSCNPFTISYIMNNEFIYIIFYNTFNFVICENMQCSYVPEFRPSLLVCSHKKLNLHLQFL